jgi:fermentation-respiration switch protein FrsA (DUF1100 family)
MRIAHWILVCFYVLLPVAVGAVAGLRAWRARSVRLARPFLMTAVSAAALSIGLVTAYAVAAGAKPLIAQILLGAYFGTAMLLTLKGLDWLLREGTERVLRLRRPAPPPRPNQPTDPAAADAPAPEPRRFVAERYILAALLRTVCLFAIGLPYVIAVVMIYRPKVIGPDPREQLGLPFETVYFPATDGTRIEGWWIPARARAGVGRTHSPEFGRRTIVFCHGLGASKSNQIGLVGELVPAGYNVLAIDLRAHGGSGGQLTSFGDLERNDVLGAVRWLRANHPDQAYRIDGLGVSMGAAALIAAAGDDSPEGRAFDAVAVYCTYDDLGALADDVAAAHLDVGPLAWLVRHVSIPIASAHVGRDLRRFAPADYVANLAPRPILVIHGKADTMIDWAHGLKLYQAAQQPRSAIWVDGADHNEVIEDAKAQKAVRAFFDRAESIL